MFRPLSGEEMMKAVPDAKLITYHDLKRKKKIDRVVPKRKPVILLYPQVESKDMISGHWVCMFRNDQGLNYFDSYGNQPDKFWKKDPKLVKLLLTCDGPMEYNENKYQGKNSEVCGRYCILRLLYKEFANNQFKSLMDLGKKKYGSYDNAVLKLTESLACLK